MGEIQGDAVQNGFSRLGREGTIHVYGVANPWERRLLHPMLLEKLETSLEEGPQVSLGTSGRRSSSCCRSRWRRGKDYSDDEGLWITLPVAVTTGSGNCAAARFALLIVWGAPLAPLASRRSLLG